MSVYELASAIKVPRSRVYDNVLGRRAIWMQLLRQVAGSVLWLLGANDGAERNLRKEAGRVPDGGVTRSEPAASERAVIAP